MAALELVGPRKVRVSAEQDSDVPESDDGGAASAMADDCRAWLEDGDAPEWAPV